MHPHRASIPVIAALVVASLASCRSYVHDWKKLASPYAVSQFDGRGETWMRTARHEWRMNAPRGGTDERGEYVEGRVEHQPLAIGPIDAVRVVAEGFVALSTSGTSEPERVRLSDVRELRVATRGRGQSSEWSKSAAVLF